RDSRIVSDSLATLFPVVIDAIGLLRSRPGSARAFGPQAANEESASDIAVLGGSVQLSSEVAAGDPVVEIAFDLAHSQSGVDDIDGHGCLDAPAGGEGKGRVEGLAGQAA